MTYHFNSVEYDTIRDIFIYLCGEVKYIIKNIAKANVLKMHKREKQNLNSCWS